MNDIKSYPNINVFWSSCPSLFKNKITDILYPDFHKKESYKIKLSLWQCFFCPDDGNSNDIDSIFFSFVGAKINKNTWYNVYCYNPLCTTKEKSCHKSCAVQSKEVMRRMNKCMMSGWLKKSQEACLGRVMTTDSKASRAHEPHLCSLFNTKRLFLELPNQKQFLNIKIILLTPQNTIITSSVSF